MKWIVVALAAVVTAAVIHWVFRLGYFAPIEISVVEHPELWTLSKDHVGPYHEIEPLIQEVEAWARGNQVPCDRTFGHFLDDPKRLDHERLRSRGGCLLPGPLKVRIPEGYQIRSLTGGKAIRAVFSGSPAIGPFRVYPLVQSRFQAEGLRQKTEAGVIEIYHPKDGALETEYLFPSEP